LGGPEPHSEEKLRRQYSFGEFTLDVERRVLLLRGLDELTLRPSPTLVCDRWSSGGPAEEALLSLSDHRISRCGGTRASVSTIFDITDRHPTRPVTILIGHYRLDPVQHCMKNRGCFPLRNQGVNRCESIRVRQPRIRHYRLAAHAFSHHPNSTLQTDA
jgi:hypothetical protein